MHVRFMLDVHSVEFRCAHPRWSSLCEGISQPCCNATPSHGLASFRAVPCVSRITFQVLVNELSLYRSKKEQVFKATLITRLE